MSEDARNVPCLSSRSVELTKPIQIIAGFYHSTPREQVLLGRLDVFEERKYRRALWWSEQGGERWVS